MRNILFALLFITACSPSYQRCKDKYGAESLVTYKDSTVYLIDTVRTKADTLSGEVSLEELLAGDYVKETTKQKTNIELKKGKIEYRNICKPETYYINRKFKYTYVITKTQTFKDQSVAQKAYDSIKLWWWLVLIAVIFVTAHLINAVKK